VQELSCKTYVKETIGGGIEVREGKEEDISWYWMTVRKREDTGN
jgi:hypothetical protein